MRRLAVGGRAALFSVVRQDLFELNATADLIWQGLGEPVEHVAGRLQALGASEEDADRFVRQMRDAWLTGGWIMPADVARRLSAAPTRVLSLSVLDVGYALEVFGAEPEGLFDMLAPLRTEIAPRHVFRIAAVAEDWLLFTDQGCRGLFAANALAPALKGAMVERLADSLEDGFVTHGALLERSGRRLFLDGAPKAGKSTLALALATSGFACLSDDVVQVTDDGRLRGARFAPTLKPGSWPLLADRIEGLESLPVHRREDGQDVRYLPTLAADGEAGGLDVFIALARREDGPAELEPLPSLHAMKSLLESAVAAERAISEDRIAALARTFDAARCFVLRYSDLSRAVEAVRGLVDD